jgi:hypothetical protein
MERRFVEGRAPQIHGHRHIGAGGAVIIAHDRSTPSRMAAMTSPAERRAAASHSTTALLDENSASSAMTSIISIRKY